jgi:hypothetical protein
MLVNFGSHLLRSLGLGTGQQDPGALRHPVGRVSIAQQAT